MYQEIAVRPSACSRRRLPGKTRLRNDPLYVEFQLGSLTLPILYIRSLIVVRIAVMLLLLQISKTLTRAPLARNSLGIKLI